MPFCPNLSCLVAKEACLRINLAQIMCEPFSFGNVSNSGVVDDRSEECWWSSFCSAPLQQPPLHEYEMIMTLCVFIWEYIRSRGKLNRKTNMSRWQFCLCGSMTFFLRLKSTWWSFSHASFKSQNFGGLFQDSCFLFLVLTMVMVSTAKSVCLDVQTMPQSNAKIPPPQATFDSRKGKLFSV